jgi:UDP:flavonoid glycosyltransferase YjiC (YdhE family)
MALPKLSPVPRPAIRRSRIVLTTFGSLGDVHPYIAVGLALQARGHEVVLATCAFYRDKAAALGLGFHAVRPDLPDVQSDPALLHKVLDLRSGTEYVIRRLLLPALRDSYDDLRAAADGADLLVSHPLTFAARLVADTTGVRWASTMLAPIGFFSAYDPPVLPGVPVLPRLRFLGPAVHRPLIRFIKWTVRSWGDPWRRLRADLGQPPANGAPLADGQHAPALVLALFSELLGAKQADWPPQTRVAGFTFYDRDGPDGMPPELARFLDAGPPPIVFTLGTSAVLDAGSFYEHSMAAARALGRRAVLLVGKGPRNRPAGLPDGVVAFDYAPYSELFPRAAAVVHQGGVGTTGQAMRAGRPMLVLPYAHDQPDNAARVARLGIARVVPRRCYTPERAARELRRLLDDPAYAVRAAAVGERVRREDGVRVACDALEAMLGAPRHFKTNGRPL